MIRADDIFLRSIDEVDENFAAFNMAKEARAEACAVCGAFDEARNIGEDETAADADICLLYTSDAADE